MYVMPRHKLLNNEVIVEPKVSTPVISKLTIGHDSE
jgi:hypothetical protein